MIILKEFLGGPAQRVVVKSDNGPVSFPGKEQVEKTMDPGDTHEQSWLRIIMSGFFILEEIDLLLWLAVSYFETGGRTTRGQPSGNACTLHRAAE